jgi:hypothetical protein
MQARPPMHLICYLFFNFILIVFDALYRIVSVEAFSFIAIKYKAYLVKVIHTNSGIACCVVG